MTRRITKHAKVRSVSTVKATEVVTALRKLAEPKQIPNIERFFRGKDKSNKFLGVRMGRIFEEAKKHSGMPLSEIDKLLKSKYYEVRMGAVSIMDFQARNKKISDKQRKGLFDLYIKQHSRINNWDLVDRSAPYVVGAYLSDKPRNVLYKLAKSKDPLQRRTSIVSTWYFIRSNDVSDTFRIAEMLVDDQDELVQKAVGSWVREAGKRDKRQLISFLDHYASTMPRPMLRNMIEKLDPKQKAFYMAKAAV